MSSFGRMSSLTIAAVGQRMSLTAIVECGDRLDVHHHPSRVGQWASCGRLASAEGPRSVCARWSQPAESAPGVRGVGDSGAPPGVCARLDLPRKEGRRWLGRPLLTARGLGRRTRWGNVGFGAMRARPMRWYRVARLSPSGLRQGIFGSVGSAVRATTERSHRRYTRDPRACRRRQAGVSRGQAFRRPREPRERQCVRRPSSCRCQGRCPHDGCTRGAGGSGVVHGAAPMAAGACGIPNRGSARSSG